MEIFEISPRYCSWRSQSIKIGTDLTIDKSIKVGKFDLIDIDFDQSVEIDDTLICFIDFLDLYRFYRFLTGNFWPSEILYRPRNSAS